MTLDARVVTGWAATSIAALALAVLVGAARVVRARARPPRPRRATGPSGDRGGDGSWCTRATYRCTSKDWARCRRSTPSTVTARVDGELQKVGFVEGQTVKKGDSGADRSAPVPGRARSGDCDRRPRTRRSSRAPRRDLERYELLAPQNLASKQTLDAQRALVAQLQAQIKGDQADIDNARTQLELHDASLRRFEGRTGIRRSIRATTCTPPIPTASSWSPRCSRSRDLHAARGCAAAVNRALEAGAVSVTALSRDGKTRARSRHHRARRQPDRSDHRHDPGEGDLPEPADALWPGQFVNARVLRADSSTTH